MVNESKNCTELRIWMLRIGLKPAQIKEDLKFKDTSAVTHFINGDLVSRPIAAYLLGKGCPKDIIDVKAGRVAV